VSSIPPEVSSLVERFTRNRESYKNPAYNETIGAGLGDLVQQMLDLYKQLSAAKTPHEKTTLQRQIDATDRQIDQLVYELYALTDGEIRMVEEPTTV